MSKAGTGRSGAGKAAAGKAGADKPGAGGAGVLVIDVGGNNAKCWCSNVGERRRLPSGPDFTPGLLIEGVATLCADWTFDRVAIGVPGPVRENKLVLQPHNLGPGWVGFDFEQAMGHKVRLVNDAAMQALGSYDGGRMLFLGFGTGLGACLVFERITVPLELAHLPYKGKDTFEDRVGQRGLVRLGRKRWRKAVHDVVPRLMAAMVVDYAVLGGGNAKLLDELPRDTRRGANENAFFGGLRLWEPDAVRPAAIVADATLRPA